MAAVANRISEVGHRGNMIEWLCFLYQTLPTFTIDVFFVSNPSLAIPSMAAAMSIKFIQHAES